MNTRNTKQKEIILHTIQSMDTHPTILEIYDAVCKVDASIGQATVYRNVSKLVEEGMVCRIPTNDGQDHYDGNCRRHYHFFCKQCHQLFDLYDGEVFMLIEKMKKNYQFQINDIHILCEGICTNCESCNSSLLENNNYKE